MSLIQWNGIWMLDGDSLFTNSEIRRHRRLDWDDSYRRISEFSSIENSDVIIDVGAYIGDSTFFFQEKGCKIIAFEPQLDAFECLTRNCRSAMCINQCVGNGEIISLHNQDSGNLGARRVYSKDITNPSTECPRYSVAIPLDCLRLTKVTCIKIDVEGFEPKVLEGAKNLIQRDRPLLLIEFNPGALRMHGFTTQDIVDQIPNYSFRETFRCGQDNWDVLGTYSQ